jgi:predicted PurR-regulated permease PerM
MNTIRLPFYAKLALILLSLVIIVFLLYVGQSVLIPLFFAIHIAFLLYPFARYMENRWNLSRSVSSLIAVTLFVIVIAAFLYFITFQLMLFSQDLPLLQQQLNVLSADFRAWVSKRYHIDSSQQLIYMNNMMNDFLSRAGDYLGSLFIDISGIIFWTIIIFIYTYFILHHRRLIQNFIIALFPREDNAKLCSIVMETRAVANHYLVGLLIEFIVVAIANSVAFGLLNVPYWLLLGLLTAMLNFIPYIGIIVGTALVLVVTMMHGSAALAFQAGAALFILHILDANILLPRVVGNKVKMNALITIISVLVGGALWGVAGMFLSIPITAILKIIFEQVNELKPWAMLMGVDDSMAKK